MAQSSWWNPGRPRFGGAEPQLQLRGAPEVLDQVGLVIYPVNGLRLHWAADYYRQLRRKGSLGKDRESEAAQPLPDFGVLGGLKGSRVLAVGSGVPDLVREMGYQPQSYYRSIIDLDNSYEMSRRQRLRDYGGLNPDMNPFRSFTGHAGGVYKGKPALLLVTGERQFDLTGHEWGPLPLETVAKLANLLISNFHLPGEGWVRKFVVRGPDFGEIDPEDVDAVQADEIRKNLLTGASFARHWQTLIDRGMIPNIPKPPIIYDLSVSLSDWYGTFPEIQRLMTQRRNQSQWLAEHFLHPAVRSRLFPDYMQVAREVQRGLRKPLDVADPLPPPPLRDFPKLAQESVQAAKADGTLAEWGEKAEILTEPFELLEKGVEVEYPPRWQIADETFSVATLMAAAKDEKALQQWFKNASAVQKLPRDVSAPVIPFSSIRALAITSFGVAKPGGEYERLDTYLWQKGQPFNLQLPNAHAIAKAWGADKKGNTKAPLPFNTGYVAIVDLNAVQKLNDKSALALRASAYLDPTRRYAIVYGSPAEDGYFNIQNPSAKVSEPLLKVLMGVEFDHDSLRENWWFTPQPQVPNIFSFNIVSQTDSFKKLYAKMKSKAEPGETQIAQNAYYKRMSFILVPPRAKMSKEVRAGKVWREAMGGPGTALVKVFPQEGGDRIAFKRDPDAIAVSEARAPKGSLYSGAARIYLEVSAKEQIPIHASRESTVLDSEILELLASYNIPIPNLPVREKYPSDEKFQAALTRYYSRVEKALAKLEDSLSIRYEHEIPRNYRPAEAEEEAYVPGPYDILKSSYLAEEEAGDSDAAEVREFREGMLMSFNPDDSYGRRERRPRRPRRERGERRLHTYFTDDAYDNPFDKDMVQRADNLLQGISKGEDRATAEEFLSAELQKLREKSPPEGWNLAQSTALFPRAAGTKPIDSRMDPGKYKRTEALTGFDLVSRLIQPPIGEDVRGLEREAPRFWEEDAGARAVTQQAELSLDQAKQIWQQQGKAYGSRIKRTIPASISVFKPIRVRRLKSYKIPSAVMDAVVDGKPLRNDVLIWVSPPQADRVRVMTFRKGSHLDADMVEFPAQNLTASALIGRAIQSAMYWIGENFDRRARRGETRIVLGRIGDPRVNILWDPRKDQTLNLGIVQRRLGVGMEGAESKTIPGYEDRDQEMDENHYLYEASRQPVGKVETQKVAEGAPPPPVPRPATEPPPAPEPVEGVAPLPRHVVEQVEKPNIFAEDVDKPVLSGLGRPGAFDMGKIGPPKGGQGEEE